MIVNSLISILIIFFINRSMIYIECYPVQGVVDLDSLTFEKVISKFKTVLVKFDYPSPNEAKQQIFEKVVFYLRKTPELLLAEITVRDYDKYEYNYDLLNRYGLKMPEFPQFILFINGNTDKPIMFRDHYKEFNQQNLEDFVMKNSAVRLTCRVCIPQLDRISSQFMAKGLSKTKQKIRLDKAKKFANSLYNVNDRETANIYIEIMQKVIERSNLFVESEEQRLRNLLNGKLFHSKRIELLKRLDITTTFII